MPEGWLSELPSYGYGVPGTLLVDYEGIVFLFSTGHCIVMPLAGKAPHKTANLAIGIFRT
jgi:hypothetical protein